jgi:methionyl-tRNA synthetase
MESLASPLLSQLALLALVTAPLKGIAMWMAARRSHLVWFIILLVVNTFGILDAIYIIWVGKRYTVESSADTAKPKPGQK